ncbi:MAG TPA: hypothetical protein DEP45_04065 [Armatimonadetes bacterium]|nr:hypothetical protein [Armatimonadota bacterium]
MAAATAAPESPLSLKPEFRESAARWEAFWAGEMLDRPPVVITCPGDGSVRAPRPNYWTMLNDPIEQVLAGTDAWVRSMHWGGDAMPQFSPGFGPDIFAAFLGAEIEFSRGMETRTSWAVTFVEDWRDVLPLTIETDGRYWMRMRELYQRLAEVAEGHWLVSHLDLHSNLDALESIRGASRLCLDLYDFPELIREANGQVRALYGPVYETFYADGRMDRCGTGAGWIGAFCEGRCNTIQCDFAALIGPSQFRELAVPDLTAEAEHLDHCIYHWDGPSALCHIDDLMGIEAIDCIQWVPGAGNPPLVEWLDLLEEVQRRGKSVMCYGSLEDLPRFHERLDPARLFYTAGARDREEIERTLEWVEQNS